VPAKSEAGEKIWRLRAIYAKSRLLHRQPLARQSEYCVMPALSVFFIHHLIHLIFYFHLPPKIARDAQPGI
jgi:hypothetical protein